MRETLTTILDATGIPWRYGGSDCHWNVLARSNIKGWTAEQRLALENAVTAAGYKVTPDCVRFSGRYFETWRPKYGFRVY